MSKEDAKRRILLDLSLTPSVSGESYGLLSVYVVYKIL